MSRNVCATGVRVTYIYAYVKGRMSENLQVSSMHVE